MYDYEIGLLASAID